MKLIPQYLNAFRKRVYYRWGKCLKAMCSQSYGFSSSQVYMEELDHKEGWVLKNWCFWIVVLEKTLEHGWHHQLNGHESEQALGDSEGQGSLECCSPWGCKKLDMTERLNNNNNHGIKWRNPKKIHLWNNWLRQDCHWMQWKKVNLFHK